MELWDLYNENRELLGKTHVRGEELPDGCLHLAVHVWIKNSEGKYLISQRSENKDRYPLYFECVGGSVLAGETSEHAALREAFEEVGVKLDESKGSVVYTKTRTIVSGVKHNDIMDVWLFEFDGEPSLEIATTDEVCAVDWRTPEEIMELYKSQKLVPTLEYFFDVVQNAQIKKTQNIKKNTSKNNKNKKKIKKLSENSRYFDFYDDIKSGCHKVIDW